MTMLHAQGGPAEEKQEEGRPAQPLLHRGIWTRPSVRYKVVDKLSTLRYGGVGQVGLRRHVSVGNCDGQAFTLIQV